MSAVSFQEVFQRFFGVLEDQRVDYMAYGGVAVAVWGDPRETQDVDAVVIVPEDASCRPLELLAAAGFQVPALASTTFPIDGWTRCSLGGRHADLALGRTPFDESAFGRRVRRRLFGRDIWLASAEDLILYKLVAHRFKDLADAQAVVRRQAQKLDVGYLREWALEIATHSRKFEVPQKLEELLGEGGL